VSLLEIQIKNVRNINSISLQPSHKLNLIVGHNGSGKTSILESLYLLSRARSFRTQNINKVISYDKANLIVFAELNISGDLNKVAIKKSHHETIIRINGRTEKKASELSRHLHTHLIRPESQTLLENGASMRRSFIDLGVFHVKHGFLETSKKHNQLLKQRNKLLKSKQLDTLSVWNNKFVEYGIILTNERERYVFLLQEELHKIINAFISNIEVKLNYLKGWDKSVSLADALTKAASRDIQYGFSTIGAHKSDIRVIVNDKPAKDYLSRGQMKLLVIALYLAQIKLMNDNSDKSVCVLLDDLAAELDVDSLAKVMFFLDKLNVQVFVTTTNEDLFKQFIEDNESKVFHVKHGEIQKKETA
jgi:DNA replication and repair protein RecF